MSVTWPEDYGDGQPAALDYRPADTTLVQAGHDLGEQAECVLGSGSNFASGTSSTGMVDTSYLPTEAQILHQTTTGMY
jgi:hypothetical protein